MPFLVPPDHAGDAFGNISHSIRAVHRKIFPGQILFQICDGVQPESGDPPIQPPVGHPINFFPQSRVLPIQVRLLFRKKMQIVEILLAGKLLPGAAPEQGSPVIGRLTVPAFLQIKIASVWAKRILDGLLKPFVLIGTVIDHQIQNQIHSSFFHLRDQLIKILQGAKTRIHAVIIGDIVSVVHHGGRIHRGQPEQIHAEPLQIVQFLQDAWQITDSVSVAVIETFGINLISHKAVPPLSLHSRFLPSSTKEIFARASGSMPAAKK